MSKAQIGVGAAVIASLIITISLFHTVSAGVIAAPADWLASPWRLAAGCTVAAGLMLALSIGEIAAARFFSAADIDGAGLTEASAPFKLRRAVAENTLEQAVLAVIAYAGLAAFAPTRWLSILPVCAGLFVIGRVLFRLGYAHGAPWRAPGFSLTWQPTLGLYVLALLCMLG